MFRTVSDGKRLLVVLDNARDAEQVGPLLPGTGTVAVVITSRNRLTGLVAAVGADTVDLDVFTLGEAHLLLRARIGAQRVRADLDAAARIVTACAGLPLALSLTAARAQQAAFPLAMIAAELGEAGSRLDVLDAGDRASGPSTVFSWSYDALSPAAARLFRLLGLHPGPDVTVPAAASLAGQPLDEVRRNLRELHAASLITERRPGRFTVHDLLRAFAQELAHRHDSEATGRAAVTRLIEHYLHTSYQAGRSLRTPQHHGEPDPARPGVVVTALPGHSDAAVWLTAEAEVLLACIDRAAELGLDRHTYHLALNIDDLLDGRARWEELRHTLRLANTSAERLGDPRLQAHASRYIARAYTRLGQHDDALTALDHALRLFEALDDTSGRCVTHWNRCQVYHHLGRHTDAHAEATRAVCLADRVGDPQLRAGALNALGSSCLALGDPHGALEHLQPAVTLSRAHAPHSEPSVLDSLASTYRLLGRHDEAVTCYREALNLYQRVANHRGLGMVLTGLGDTYAAAGDHTAARTAWQQALDIYRAINHPDTDAIHARLTSGP
jgi:tetratricopeptide (TPR) repeat protein